MDLELKIETLYLKAIEESKKLHGGELFPEEVFSLFIEKLDLDELDNVSIEVKNRKKNIYVPLIESIHELKSKNGEVNKKELLPLLINKIYSPKKDKKTYEK